MKTRKGFFAVQLLKLRHRRDKLFFTLGAAVGACAALTVRKLVEKIKAAVKKHCSKKTKTEE